MCDTRDTLSSWIDWGYNNVTQTEDKLLWTIRKCCVRVWEEGRILVWKLLTFASLLLLLGICGWYSVCPLIVYPKIHFLLNQYWFKRAQFQGDLKDQNINIGVQPMGYHKLTGIEGVSEEENNSNPTPFKSPSTLFLPQSKSHWSRGAENVVWGWNATRKTKVRVWVIGRDELLSINRSDLFLNTSNGPHSCRTRE